MRKKVFSPLLLALIAVTISVLAAGLILAAGSVFIDNTRATRIPWSDWGARLGS